MFKTQNNEWMDTLKKEHYKNIDCIYFHAIMHRLDDVSKNYRFVCLVKKSGIIKSSSNSRRTRRSNPMDLLHTPPEIICIEYI